MNTTSNNSPLTIVLVLAAGIAAAAFWFSTGDAEAHAEPTPPFDPNENRRFLEQTSPGPTRNAIASLERSVSRYDSDLTRDLPPEEAASSVNAAWEDLPRNAVRIVDNLFDGKPVETRMLFRSQQLNPVDRPIAQEHVDDISSRFDRSLALMLEARKTALTTSGDELALLRDAGRARNRSEEEFLASLDESEREQARAEITAAKASYRRETARRLRADGMPPREIPDEEIHVIEPRKQLGFEPYACAYMPGGRLFGAELSELPGTTEAVYYQLYAMLECVGIALEVSVHAKELTQRQADLRLEEISLRFIQHHGLQ